MEDNRISTWNTWRTNLLAGDVLTALNCV